MTASQYLSQLYTIDDRFAHDLAQLDELRDRAMSGGGAIRYDKDKVQTSATNNAMDPIIEYVDTEADVDRRLDGYVRLRSKIIAQILGMQDPLHAQILFDIFAINMDMHATAKDINYSYRHTYNLYEEALAAFAQQYLTQTT